MKFLRKDCERDETDFQTSYTFVISPFAGELNTFYKPIIYSATNYVKKSKEFRVELN